MAKRKMQTLFPENNSFFKRRFINRKLRTTNKHTRFFNISIARVSVAKSGLRFIALKLKRKQDISIGKNIVRGYIWENTQGAIRVGTYNKKVQMKELKYLKHDLKILYDTLLFRQKTLRQLIIYC